MFKKVCLSSKEPFNLLILGSLYPPEDILLLIELPIQTEKSPEKNPDFSITISRTVLAEHPPKIPLICT
jgi:hypothetical protein